MLIKNDDPRSPSEPRTKQARDLFLTPGRSYLMDGLSPKTKI
jgi:hypothetical protein